MCDDEDEVEQFEIHEVADEEINCE